MVSKDQTFLCQGEVWKQFAINEIKIPKEKTRIIKNWTATKKLLEAGKGRSFSKKFKKKEIIFIGWLEKSKGVFELLESIRLLSQNKNNNLHLSMMEMEMHFEKQKIF